MDPGSLPAPLDALDHPVMSKLMQALAQDGYSELQSRTPPTYTSFATTKRRNDELNRNWFVALQIARIHLGVSNLPDPLEALLLEPSEWASVTPEQSAAVAKIQEWWLEGSYYVMMRFFNMGLGRVSTAAHLYALDALLWMRGYAIPLGDSVELHFNYTQPSAHIGPFSSEYDHFFAERFRERYMAGLTVTASYTPSPIARDAAIDQPSSRVREEINPYPPTNSVTDAHLSSTAKPSSGLSSPNLSNGGISQSTRQGTRIATPAPADPLATSTVPATEEHSMPRAKLGGADEPNFTTADDNPPPQRGAKPGLLENSATQAHALTAAQPSHAPNKRSVNVADAIAQAPQSKRQQAGGRLCLKTLTSLGLIGPNEAKLRFSPKIKSRASTVPKDTTQARAAGGAAVKLCGNQECRSPHHELADCLGPLFSNTGFLDGCPFHNTQTHDLDQCGFIYRGQVTKDELFDVLVTRRANLPPIKTAISLLYLAATMGKLEVLAKTMPLDRRTARDTYAPMRLWKKADWARLSLFRDPLFPSDPEAFMEKLFDFWHDVVNGTTRQDLSDPRSLPYDIRTLFATEWIAELVPYSKVFEKARVSVSGRDVYLFCRKEDLVKRQNEHHEKAKELLKEMRTARAQDHRGQNQN